MDLSDVKDALETADYTLSDQSSEGLTYVKTFPRDNSYCEAYLDRTVNKVEFSRYNSKDSLLGYNAFTITPDNTRAILGHITP